MEPVMCTAPELLSVLMQPGAFFVDDLHQTDQKSVHLV